MTNLLFQVTNFVNIPWTGSVTNDTGRVRLTPNSSPMSYGNAIAGMDFYELFPDVTGSALFTNVFPGVYYVEFLGSIARTPFYISVPELSGSTVNANQCILTKVTLTDSSSLAYTIFASDSRFLHTYDTASWSINSLTASFFSGSISNASTATTATTASNVNVNVTKSNASYYVPFVQSVGVQPVYIDTGSILYNPSKNLLTVQNISASSVTASLLGTASWANTSTTASFAVNAGSGGTTLQTASTYPITSSWANNSVSASWAPSSSPGTILNTGSTYQITSSWANNTLNSTSASWASQSAFAPVIFSNFQIVNGLPLISDESGSWYALSVWYDTATSASTLQITPTINTGSIFASSSIYQITSSLQITSSISASWASSSYTASYLSGSAYVPFKDVNGDTWYFNGSEWWDTTQTTVVPVGRWYGGTQPYLEINGQLNLQSLNANGTNPYIYLLDNNSNGNHYNLIELRRGSNLLSYFDRTGSFIGTSSWANTASFAVNVPQAVSSSYSLSGSMATSASLSVNAHNVLIGLDTGSDSLFNYLTFGPGDGTYSGYNGLSVFSASYQPSTDTIKATNFQGTASRATTASFALNALGGSGTTLNTGSVYYITSSWANNAISASWAPGSGGGTTLNTGSVYYITSSWAQSSSFVSSYQPYSIISTGSNNWITVSFANPNELVNITTAGTYNFTSSNKPNVGYISDVLLYLSHSAAASSSLSFPGTWQNLGYGWPTAIPASTVGVIWLRCVDSGSNIVGTFNISGSATNVANYFLVNTSSNNAVTVSFLNPNQELQINVSGSYTFTSVNPPIQGQTADVIMYVTNSVTNATSSLVFPASWVNYSGGWPSSMTASSTAVLWLRAIDASTVVGTWNNGVSQVTNFVGTSSWANNAVSATTANTASYISAGNVVGAVTTANTASYISSSAKFDLTVYQHTASWASNVVSSSYAVQSSTASYVLNAVSSSFASQAANASSATSATTATFANGLNAGATLLVPGTSTGFFWSASAATIQTGSFTNLIPLTGMGPGGGYFVRSFLSGYWSASIADPVGYYGEWFVQENSASAPQPGMIIREVNNNSGDKRIISRVVDGGTGSINVTQYIAFALSGSTSPSTVTVTALYERLGINNPGA